MYSLHTPKLKIKSNPSYHNNNLYAHQHIIEVSQDNILLRIINLKILGLHFTEYYMYNFRN